MEPGDIVQIKPDLKTKAFAGCLMVVTEVKDWGVEGYVQTVGDVERVKTGGQAYYRAETGSFEPTGGKAVWITGN